jgi:two-component system, cell cycle sensor histidine kinase and response regulator CckA
MAARATPAAPGLCPAVLDAIVRHSSDLIYVKDLDSRYLLVNDRFCVAIGLTRDQVVGRTAADVLPRALADECTANDHKVLESGTTMTFVEHVDLPGEKRDLVSTRFPVRDEQGRVVAVAGLSVDVTDQHRAEASLRASEEKFRLAFNLNPLAINLNALKDGRYLEINEGFTRLMGYTREDVLGRSSVELGIWCEPADRLRLVEELREAGRTANLRARFRRKDGTIGIGVMSAAVVRIGGEDVILSLTSDVTREVELEEEMRQAQKMEALGRLAGGIAHDFNNLLVPILGYAEMLADTLAPDDQRREMTAAVLDAGHRAAALTRQILAFSRSQVLDIKPISLNDLISSFRPMLRRLVSEAIETRFEVDPAAPIVQADRVQVEQILLNLAVNAADAMPSGGVLTVETGLGTQDAPVGGVFADEPSPGRYATITVRDTGVGMSAETMAHLFEPFFTTKQAGKGTGLGLATVFGIVKQHRGNVWAASEQGRGATFRVYLPLATGPALARDPDAGRQTESRRGSERVLVVEDDLHVRRFVCEALEACGYSVRSADSPAEALKECESWTGADVPRILVTDMVMPGASGRELYEALKARFPTLRVLFVSGYAPGLARGALEQPLDLLQKPFSVDALLLKVRAVLDRP